MTLTQKETMLLEDMKSQEKLCIEKYTRFGSEACDGNLKNLFNYMCSVEQKHLETLDKISAGQVPTVNGGGQSNQPVCTPVYASCSADDVNKKKDAFLCQDALSGEKHVSSVYDTCIFEFSDSSLRNVLNHIQKEEQKHGEMIYGYMSCNNMYC